MKTEDNGSNDYKNCHIKPSIIINKSILEKVNYDFNYFDIENLEDDNNSLSKTDETYPSIAINKSISKIDGDLFNNFHTKNVEKDNTSLSKVNCSKFIEFPYNFEESIDDKNGLDEKDIYFIGGEKNLANQNNNINLKTKKFKISTKKRGRKKEIQLNKKRKEKSHNKYAKDNLIRKCQVSYFNFMIKFLNALIKLFKSKMKLDPKREFIPIDNDIKKTVNKAQKIKLHINSIEEMIRNNISKKHSKSKPTSNKDLCEEIKKYGIPEIEKIFKKNFISLFDIYHKSIRKFDLKVLDESLSNITIEIPEKVELYKDMLNKNRKDTNFEEFKILMENNIKNYFKCNMLFCTKLK